MDFNDFTENQWFFRGVFMKKDLASLRFWSVCFFGSWEEVVEKST